MKAVSPVVSAWNIAMFCDWGHGIVCVCVYACVSGGLLLEAPQVHTCCLCFLADFRDKERHKWVV